MGRLLCGVVRVFVGRLLCGVVRVFVGRHCSLPAFCNSITSALDHALL